VVEALTPDGARRFRREGGIDVGERGGELAAHELGLRLGVEIHAEAGEALVA
jgi:hydroxymethylbilane synthase